MDKDESVEIDQENDDDQESENENGGSSKKKGKYRAKKFKESWTEEFKWIIPDGDDKQGKKCKICNISITGSKTHIKRHMESAFHKRNISCKQQTVKIDSFITDSKDSNDIEMAKKLEVSLSMFVAEHNLPFKCVDHLNKKCLIQKLLKK